MEEIGVVKSLDGITAKVVVSRKGGCCESCTEDSCTIPEKGIETEAINRAGARVGQKVKVVMSPYTYLKGAMIIYVLPVIALIAGAILGKMYLTPYFSSINTDLVAAISGFGALIGSIVLMKIISARMTKKTGYQSVIESIVEG